MSGGRGVDREPGASGGEVEVSVVVRVPGGLDGDGGSARAFHGHGPHAFESRGRTGGDDRQRPGAPKIHHGVGGGQIEGTVRRSDDGSGGTDLHAGKVGCKTSIELDVLRVGRARTGSRDERKPVVDVVVFVRGFDVDEPAGIEPDDAGAGQVEFVVGGQAHVGVGHHRDVVRRIGADRQIPSERNLEVPVGGNGDVHRGFDDDVLFVRRGDFDVGGGIDLPGQIQPEGVGLGSGTDDGDLVGIFESGLFGNGDEKTVFPGFESLSGIGAQPDGGDDLLTGDLHVDRGGVFHVFDRVFGSGNVESAILHEDVVLGGLYPDLAADWIVLRSVSGEDDVLVVAGDLDLDRFVQAGEIYGGGEGITLVPLPGEGDRGGVYDDDFGEVVEPVRVEHRGESLAIYVRSAFRTLDVVIIVSRHKSNPPM